MDNLRLKRETLEDTLIGPFGVKARDSKGRQIPEEEDGIRTCFQRDVDRITYSKAFRRLKHKTQVFLSPEGDHYRTRLTHTLEVTRLARTMARALQLNEDLTEAVGLGHDLGHTPFGHAGERALNVLMADHGGFRHYEQSLRVVDRLEKNLRGLNLTCEVRDGILRHTNDPWASTLEGQLVRRADLIAYLNHDLDDAIRAGLLTEADVPEEITAALGTTHSQRINTMVCDVIECSMGKDRLSMSPGVFLLQEGFNSFMYEQVYKNPKAKSEEDKVLGILEGLFRHYAADADRLPGDYRRIADEEGIDRAVCDYISGMTDDFAVECFERIYVPGSWTIK